MTETLSDASFAWLPASASPTFSALSSVDTEDDTETEVASFAIPDGSAVDMTCNVIAHALDHSKNFALDLRAAYARDGANYATVRAPSSSSPSSVNPAGWTARIARSGATLSVLVKGEDALDVRWSAQSNAQVVKAANGIDIAASAPTMYLKDFASAPWAGSASSGASALYKFANGFVSSAGGSFGAHSSADLGSVGYLVGQLVADSSGITLADLIDADGFTLDFIVEVHNASSPDANPYNEKRIFGCANTNLYVCHTTAGVRFGFYDGTSYKVTGSVALPTNTKAHVQCVYDGTNITCRVNGGTWTTPVAAASVDSSAMGSQPYVGNVDADIARALAWDRVLDSGELDGLNADATANYGV